MQATTFSHKTINDVQTRIPEQEWTLIIFGGT